MHYRHYRQYPAGLSLCMSKTTLRGQSDKVVPRIVKSGSTGCDLAPTRVPYNSVALNLLKSWCRLILLDTIQSLSVVNQFHVMAALDEFDDLFEGDNLLIDGVAGDVGSPQGSFALGSGSGLGSGSAGLATHGGVHVKEEAREDLRGCHFHLPEGSVSKIHNLQSTHM
jgi:hypothetical protein